jgi:hypothetical protein
VKLFVEPWAGDEGKIGEIKNRDEARGDETCSAGRICFGYVVDTAMQVDTRSIREWVMIFVFSSIFCSDHWLEESRT